MLLAFSFLFEEFRSDRKQHFVFMYIEKKETEKVLKTERKQRIKIFLLKKENTLKQ